jgi:DNA processing protein
MKLSAELIYFWLSWIEGLGPKKRAAVLAENEDILYLPQDFISRAEFYSKILGADLYNRAKYMLDHAYLRRELDGILIDGIGLLTPASPEYPQNLLDIYDYPLVLYYKGDPALLKTKCVAVVGTRKASAYGERITKKFTEVFARAGLTIVAGLATGVDGYAHEKTLECGGNTIAVLGNGLKSISPVCNRNLAKKIIDSGLIITEYKPYFTGTQYSFPQRNRIISGISDATLITEAGEKSGALITADYALEQNRQLFVLPANADSERSQGALSLIRKGQCAMVYRPEQILQELNIAVKDGEKVTAIALDFNEAKILDLLEVSELNYDRISEAVDLQVSELSNLLTVMEMKGLISKRGGLYYKA